MAGKRTAQRISEALQILAALGVPDEQQNDRSALTLLALSNVSKAKSWPDATAPMIGVTPIMAFAQAEYGVTYAPNSRETFRRFTLHQFVEAGMVVANPDKPDRPVNSPKYCYQLQPATLQLVQAYGTKRWDKQLAEYRAGHAALATKYAQLRSMNLIPVSFGAGTVVNLTPGGQNPVVRDIVMEFLPRFTPGGIPLYVGDTGKKWAHYDAEGLARLGVSIESHGKMPDVVVHYEEKGWLILIEAVTSHGPMNPKRLAELKGLFAGSSAGLVFVTAFPDRATLLKFLGDIAWETEVWVADARDHMIHFNGERFLGPY